MKTTQKSLRRIKFKHLLTYLLDGRKIVAIGWNTSGNLKDKAHRYKLQLVQLCRDYGLTGTIDHKYCTEDTEADMKEALAEIIKLEAEYQDNVSVELPKGAVLYGSSCL